MQTKQENQLEINNSIGTAGYARTVGEDGKSYRTGISSLVSGAIGDDIEQLENDVEALQTTVGEHTADIGNMEDDISDLQTTVSGHTTSISGLQTTVNGHTTSIGTLANLTTTEKSNLVGAINEVNADVSDVKEDFEALETQLDETTTLALAALPQETIENVAIASFDDGADGVPVKELKIAIEPIQSGSGDPSPTNIRPISGRDSVTLTRTGVNVWDEEWELGSYDGNTGEKSESTSYWRSKNLIPVKPSQTFYFLTSGDSIWRFMYDANKNYLGYLGGINNSTWAIPDNVSYIGIVDVTRNTYDPTTKPVSINYPSTDTSYHSGTDNASYPISLSSTIYGGTLEVETGVLTVDRVYEEFDLSTLSYTTTNGYDNWTLSILNTSTGASSSTGKISNIAKYAYASSAEGTDHYYIGSTGIVLYLTEGSARDKTAQFVYPLATPTTVQLTPAQVTTLLKDNNIFADSGDIVKLIYRADLGAYIEKLINA